MLKTTFKKSIALFMVTLVLLCVAVLSAAAEDSTTAMIVTTDDGVSREFATCEEGWVYGLKQSLEKPTTIKLCADWIAPNGNFYCVDEDGDEYGTRNGELFLYDDFNLTIDLNGHKIDRNLKEAKSSGGVFYMEDVDIKLTIKDSAGGGKITGANCVYGGGAFDVYDGSLYIEGGEISGNRADKGAGIYWVSDNILCIYGGRITGNVAVHDGGGIYAEGGGVFGQNVQGRMYFGGDASIFANVGNSTISNVYLADEYQRLRRTAGQEDGAVPDVPFKKGANIGISAYDEDELLITGDDSHFKWDDYTHFYSDDSITYSIRPAYNDCLGNDWCNNENDRTHMYKMYLTPKEDIKLPKLGEIEVTESASKLVRDLVFDQNKQKVTVTAYCEDISTLNENFKQFGQAFNYKEAIVPSELEYFDGFSWSDLKRKSEAFGLVSTQDGTYGTFTLTVKWECKECDDRNGDSKCDDCGKDMYLVAIGDTKYASIAEAVANAKNGDIIKFLTNNAVVSQVVIPEGKEITIDFAGRQLLPASEADDYDYNTPGIMMGECVIINYGSLTVTDSTGNNQRNTKNYGIETHGPLTVNGGNYAETRGLCNIIYAVDAPVTINSGIFEYDASGAIIRLEGDNASVTINDGLFQSESGAYAFEAKNNPEFYINDGTFKGKMVKSGTVNCTITGGTFDTSEAYFAKDNVASGSLVASSADQTDYKILKNDYFKYLGAGLKYAGASADSAKIRFGYDFADNFNLGASNWHWNFGIDKENLAANKGENYDSNNVTNLVVSGISPDRYDTMIYSQLVFDVTIDGKVYTIKDDIRGNYVLHIANSIVANPSESEAVKEYAEQLISTYEAAKQN